MPMQEGKAGAGKQTYKSYRWHYTLMTKTVNMREEHYGLPRPHHGARHKAIRHANAVSANITQAITAAEAGIVPRAALTAAEQEIEQLKSDKGTLRQKVKEARDVGKEDFRVARDVANKAVRGMNSAKALLDTANARLTEANLETVMPKAAPTPNGTDGTEGAFSEADMNHVSMDTQLEPWDSEEKQGEQKEDS
jgi:hypothetical protein